MNTARWALIGAGLLVGGVAAGTAAAIRQFLPTELDASRWRAVTIGRPADVVAPDGHAPAPFASFVDIIDVRVNPAPGGRGTELAARLTPGAMSTEGAVARLRGKDPRQLIRKLLRESKQLAEVGEILRLDPRPEGYRRPTPQGAVVDLASRRSSAAGVL